MEIIYSSLIGAFGIIAGLLIAFFQGRKAGKADYKAEQVEQAIEIKTTIQEVDHAVNSQDRASLIESMASDSVRRTP